MNLTCPLCFLLLISHSYKSLLGGFGLVWGEIQGSIVNFEGLSSTFASNVL